MTRASGRVRGWIVASVVAAVILVVGAFAATRWRAPSAPVDGEGRRGPFLADVRAKADAIDRIEIERGTRRAVLIRAGDGWIAADKADLPIEPDRVRDLVRGLAMLEIEQAMTSNRDRHAELDLDWPSAKSAATLVRLFADGSATPFAEVVVGRQRFSPQGVYVRRLADGQTWRCAGSVAAEPDSVRLMNAVLMALPADALSSAETRGTTADAAIGRDESGAWKASAPSGEPLADPRGAEAIRLLPELFTRLEFDEARRVASPPVAAVESIVGRVGDRTVTIELLPVETTSADTTTTTTATPAGGGRWFRVLVGSPEPGLGAAAPTEATIAMLDAIAARAAGREFRLPSWRAGRLGTFLSPPAPSPDAAGG